MATPQTTCFGRFCFLNYRQQHFLFVLHKNVRRKQFQFLIQNKGLTPLKKSNMATPNIKRFTIVLSGLFSSLNYRETSFLTL